MGTIPSYANSNNAIIIGTGLNLPGPAASSMRLEAWQYFESGGQTNVPVTGGIQTITIPIGDYLSLAIDALLTGNVNADAGVNSGTGTKSANHQVQPSFLGLSQLDVNIPSSNTQGNVLSPITLSTTIRHWSPGGRIYWNRLFRHRHINSTGGVTGFWHPRQWWYLDRFIQCRSELDLRNLHGGVEPNNAPGGWNAAGGAHAAPNTGANASGNVGINEDPSGGNNSANLSAASTYGRGRSGYFAAFRPCVEYQHLILQCNGIRGQPDLSGFECWSCDFVPIR